MKTLANDSAEYCFIQELPGSNARRWWLIPHYLGLDAVAVAVVWQAAVAHFLQVQTEWSEVASLALCVFSIYLGDRLRDSYTKSHHAKPRHQFALHHRGILTAILSVTLVMGLAIAAGYLQRELLVLGIILCPVILLYFLWTQIRGVFTERGWLKEYLIGTIFAVGVFLVPALKCGSLSYSILTMAAAFGALCALNCLTICHHESREHRIDLYWIAACLTTLLQGALWVLFPDHRDYFATLLFGTLTLAALMRLRFRVNNDWFAPLADIALLIAGFLTWVK